MCWATMRLVRAVASGRQPQRDGALSPGRAALRRRQGGPPAPGDVVRRDPGPHPQRRARCGGGGGDRRAARPAYANWHVETTDETLQLRVTKKGRPLLHRAPRRRRRDVDRSHDRAKQRRLDESDPLFELLGITTADGKVKPIADGEVPPGPGPARCPRAAGRRCGRARARRCPVGGAAAAGGRSRVWQRLPDVRCLPLPDRGQGAAGRGRRRRREGAGAGPQHRPGGAAGRRRPARRSSRARSATVELAEAPDLVLALHACDTATDDALARAVRWQAPVIVAAPCCHHDIQRQLEHGAGRRRPTSWSRGTASCASGSPTCSPTRCARRSCGWSAIASRWSSSSTACTRRATR